MSSFRIVLLSLAFRWPIGASYADNDCPVVGQRQLQLEHVARQGDSEVQLRQELTVESEDRILAAVRAVVHKDSEVDQTGMGNWVITEPGGKQQQKNGNHAREAQKAVQFLQTYNSARHFLESNKLRFFLFQDNISTPRGQAEPRRN